MGVENSIPAFREREWEAGIPENCWEQEFPLTTLSRFFVIGNEFDLADDAQAAAAATEFWTRVPQWSLAKAMPSIVRFNFPPF